MSVTGSPPLANNISKISLNDINRSELVGLIENKKFQKKNGFGFEVTEKEPSLLSANLLLARPEVRQIYDDDTGLDTTEITIVKDIPFRIDFEYGVLEVFADQDSSSNLTTKLGQLTDQRILIENINFDPHKVIEIINQKYEIDLTTIKISNYPASDSVVGDFSAEVEDQEAGWSLLDDNINNISYIGVRVHTEFGSITLGIYETGSVIVYNDISESGDVIDRIKEASVRGGNNA